jgi:dihydrofolate reductase
MDSTSWGYVQRLLGQQFCKPDIQLNVSNIEKAWERANLQKHKTDEKQLTMNRTPEAAHPHAKSCKLNAVVAVAQNGVIGRNNQLPWRLRSDLQRFKRLTMGHCLIMGRKTFDSIGKALPGRTTLVLSRSPSPNLPNVQFATSIQDALALVPKDQQAFIVGGAEIYRATKSMVTDLYITRVQADVDGDAWLDEWDLSEFECIERENTPADADNQWPTLFEHWVRKTVAGHSVAV